MYTDRTRDDILEGMLEASRDDVDKREGSVVYDLLAPPAEEHEMLGFQLEAIEENGFIDTAQAEYIDRRAAELGVYRKDAEKATGTLVFADYPNTEIPIGTQVVAQSGDVVQTLQTVEYAVIPESGEVSVETEALIAGVDGNIRANSELTCEELPNAIVTNPEPFTGGVDIEPDDELKARYLLKVRKPITSGNVYHYELWAREIEGISQARVHPLWNGPGTVKVVVINSEGRAPTPDQVASVASHIEGQRPIGATVTVVSITEVPINITATLTLTGGLMPEDVRTELESNIANYLATAGTTIRYSQIANAIIDTEGVVDYSGLTIGKDETMGPDNLTIDNDAVAIVGTVVLS